MWTKLRTPGRGEWTKAELIFGAAIVLIFMAGLAFRIWLAGQPEGHLDSDGAIIGLMAIRLLRGEFSPIYWGQAYGGSHEAIMAAGLFVVAGATSFALKLVPIALAAAAAVLTWRIGKRLLGEPYGKLAGILFWIWPPFFLWWSIKMGTYWASLVSALIVFLQVLRMRDRGDWRVFDAALLGLAIGNALWANPQTMYVVIPVLLVHTWMFLKRWTRSLAAIPFVFLGALPWLIFNLQSEWASLDIPPQPSLGPIGHLSLFFRRMLPMALGLRYPFSDAWLGDWIGKLAYVLLALVFLLVVIRIRRLTALWSVFIAYPILYAISPYSWYVNEPRYLLFLAPFVCIAFAAGLRWLLSRDSSRPEVKLRPRASWAIALLVIVLTSVVLGLPTLGYLRTGGVSPTAPDLPLPASFAQLEDLLSDEGVKVAYADYWVAYRIIFETEEKVLVAPLQVHRYLAYDRKVGASVEPQPFIFLKGSRSFGNFDKLAKADSIDYEVFQRGPWLLAWPDEPVSPWELAVLNGHYSSSG